MIDNQLQIDGGNCIFNLVCFFNQNLINNIICQEGTISWWAQLLDWIIIVESNKESNNLISGNFRYFILASRFLTALSTYPDVSRNVASRGNSLHALKAFAKIFYASINCLMCWTESEHLIFWWNLISAAQFFAFFAKTKDGRAKDFSRKMRCEKFAKNCPKMAKIWLKIDLKIALFAKPLMYLNFYLGY